MKHNLGDIVLKYQIDGDIHECNRILQIKKKFNNFDEQEIEN